VDATPYTYLFIRTDLSPAQQIVQASHAALEAGNRFGPHSHLVLIAAEGEDTLLKAAAQLNEQGIELETFFEPDENAGYTAFCTQPLQGEQRKPLRKYQLYRAMEAVA
jgi:hypothetical protein